jgi:adenylate cyclase
VTAATSCRKREAEPRESAAFCDAYCSIITLSHEPAEYKHVTVLFANVVRSMDISAAVGAERLANHVGVGQPARIGGAALWGTPLG